MEQAGADKLLYKPLPKFNELKEILEKAITTARESWRICGIADAESAANPQRPLERPSPLHRPNPPICCTAESPLTSSYVCCTDQAADAPLQKEK